MRPKNLFLLCCIISLILCIYGCTNTPDNVAISSDEVEISFDKQGEGEPTLVFIHGWEHGEARAEVRGSGVARPAGCRIAKVEIAC